MNKTELISAVAEQAVLLRKMRKRQLQQLLIQLSTLLPKTRRYRLQALVHLSSARERQEQAATQEQVIQSKSQHLRFRLSRQARYLRIL